MLHFFAHQDEFWKVHEWPRWARQTIVRHKGNNDRFQLYLWLVANGLRPAVAERWVRAEDARDGRLVLDNRDKAIRHVEQMSRQLREGRLFRGNKRVFDMVKGHVVNV